MNILNKYIEIINKRINNILCDSKNELFCLTYQIIKDNNISNYCGETKVVFDDKFDNYIYYRLSSFSSEKIVGFGDSDILQINASLKMLVHSKKEIVNNLLFAISETVNKQETDIANSVSFEIQSINNDKESIYLQEIGEKSGRYSNRNYLYDIDLNLVINIDSDCLCQ